MYEKNEINNILNSEVDILSNYDVNRCIRYLQTNHDPETLGKFLIKNKGLIYSVAKYFPKEKKEDFIQEGFIGMMISIKKFDPDEGSSFATYASYWIYHSMQVYHYKNLGTMKIPLYIHRDYKKINNAKLEYISQYKKKPSEKEISQKTGFTEQYITKVIVTIENISNTSLYKKIGDDDEIIDIIKNNNTSNNIENETINKIMFDIILKSINQLLTPKEYDILRKRFGLENYSVQTLEEIANYYNLSCERIRQIQNNALMKIRKNKHIMTCIA